MNTHVIMLRVLVAVYAVWLVSGLCSQAQAQYGRSTIRVVGSSTVYPFAKTVADVFAGKTAFKPPVIESTGSGGGFRLFCAGVGVEHPDIVNASRRIKSEEFDACIANGVKQVVEIVIGYDGIVIANNNHSALFNLTRKDIFLALSKTVPDSANQPGSVPNPCQTWRCVNPRLSNMPIQVYGPSSTSGTRDAFMTLAMAGGQARGKRAHDVNDRHGQTLREDGAYIEEGENDDIIVHKLERHPDALGIFGFGFLDRNKDRLQGAIIDGVAPSSVTIASGRYPLSRPLYLYVKKAHADRIPGLRVYLEVFTSEEIWGPGGKLAEKGLVPMTDPERTQYRKIAQQLLPVLERERIRTPERCVK